RKNPQTLKASEPPETLGPREFSANPQNPQTLADTDILKPGTGAGKIATDPRPGHRALNHIFTREK
ncbi:MAG: hypothetical protein HLUCCX14_09665, partial [Marinobacter excellens HL-55]